MLGLEFRRFNIKNDKMVSLIKDIGNRSTKASIYFKWPTKASENVAFEASE